MYGDIISSLCLFDVIDADEVVAGDEKMPSLDNLDEKPISRRKPGRKPTFELTPAQSRTLEAIRTLVERNGYPPTVAELGALLGITTASAYDQLSQLIRKGYIRRTAGIARGLSIIHGPLDKPVELIPLPIVGCVAAGTPVLAQENIVDEIQVERKLLTSGRFFGLEIKGESMIGAEIFDGDVVIVRMQPVAESGSIVVALIGNDATIKRLYFTDGIVELRPENPCMQPMVINPEDDFRIIGKVVAVNRRHENGYIQQA